jgi:nitric oxide reductase NorD protein
VGGTDTAYVPAVRARHAPLIRQLRRRFEAMRGEDRVLRRQADGQEVDMDALVAAIADRRGGAEPSPASSAAASATSARWPPPSWST